MSGLPNYGLPDPTATAQAVISQMEANAQDLGAVQHALQQAIGTATGDSYQELQRVQKTLRSATGRAINYVSKYIQPPQQALAQSVAAQTAAIQGALPSAEALGSIRGPLQVPPGYPAAGVLPQAPLNPTSTSFSPSSPFPGGGSGPFSTGPGAPPSPGRTTGGASTGGSSSPAGQGPVYIVMQTNGGPGACAGVEVVNDPSAVPAGILYQSSSYEDAGAWATQYIQQHCPLGGTVAPKTPPAVVPATPPAPPPDTTAPTPAVVTPPDVGPAAGPDRPPPGVFTCPDLATAAFSPASPGSAEWCRDLQTLHAAVVGIGNSLVTAFASLTDDSGINDLLNPIPLVGSALSSLVGSSGVLDRIRCVVNSSIAAVRSLVPCSSADYLALVAVRTTLHSLERLELGTDALVWAVNAFRVSFDEVVRIVDYFIAYTCPTEIPGVPEAIEAFLHQNITREQYECWLLCRGCDPKVWEPVLQTRGQRLLAKEAIEYGFRVGWTQEQIQARLRELGWLNDQDQSEALAMHFHLPTIGDQLHFLQRNVFMEDYVQKYRLDEGFLERYWSHFGTQLQAIGVPQETARLHYAAHWINPAPTEMREFAYRLRPDKPGVQNPFTLEDYERLLVEQDVAPFFRERFRETIYRVPALGYVRDMYRSFILDDEELRSIHQDLGYSPVDSERFLKVDRLLRARIRSSEAHGWTPAAIAQGFVAGVLSRERVYALMLDQGFQNWEADALMERAEANLKYGIFVRSRSRTISNVALDIQNGLDVGTWRSEDAVQALTALGFDQEFAQGWVGVQQSRAQTRLVKQTVTRLRSGYLRGELNDQGARAALQALNLTPEAIDRYLVGWSLSLTPKRKSLSKAEILSETCSGHFSTAEALARLLNLGYSEEDAGLFLADAQQCLVKRRQQAELAEQRKASAAASQIQRLRREAQSQAKALGSQARRLEPVAKLQKWARLGLIDASYFQTRLRSYGYSPSEIDRYWDEAAAAKGSEAKAHATASLHGPGG